MNKTSMTDFHSGVFDRLMEVCEIRTHAELAKLLNMSQQNLSKTKLRRSVPYSRICELADSRGLSLDYILLGKNPATENGLLDGDLFNDVAEKFSIAAKHDKHLSKVANAFHLAQIYNLVFSDIANGEDKASAIENGVAFVCSIISHTSIVHDPKKGGPMQCQDQTAIRKDGGCID